MDDIVVSGISGRLPESDNLEEFWKHLINKDNLVTEDNRRWEPGMLFNTVVNPRGRDLPTDKCPCFPLPYPLELFTTIINQKFVCRLNTIICNAI